ncbi:hybrid sensor histidine kinase/response regulator transcription factor [Arsenicibacter rosenii]|uniref:histidine kinase n=1 Tax=Arsenicibacter rosenii TaxID=1750698 RepID=A0A1S2VCZ3_9BACT|nr:substrate-binding domain-containing protein [Arsenicibacter rosenii]OIN56290.1 AraC family transcriptional regulator [Arsenicibacter rosenii]
MSIPFVSRVIWQGKKSAYGLMPVWISVVGIMMTGLLAGCATNETGPAYRIAFSQCTGGDLWRQTMLSDMKRALSFHPDCSLLYEDANNSTEKQIAQIRSLARQNIDLLIVSPNESAPITKAIDDVFRQGIPVIVIDRRINSASYNAFIGGDNVEIGRLAARFIGNYLKGKGRLIEVTGLTGSSPAQDRHQGFTEVMRQFPAIKTIATFDGHWEKDSARLLAQRQLPAFQSADIVFAHNDVMALGMYAVCRRNGLANRLPFVGIDALPGPTGGMQLVSDGILKATFLYPTGGEEAIETAIRILEGKSVQRENVLNSVQVDAGNVKALKTQSDKLLTQQRDIERQSQRIAELTRTYLTQRNTLSIMLASLIGAILLGAWAFYLVRSKQRAYQILARQNDEISEQRDKIDLVSQQARLATEEKLRFYSYISHEFNTPLSLILTPTEDMLSKKSVGMAELKNNLSLVQKNAHRLLRLVDQMLDLRKTDSGKLVLRASEQNVVRFIQDIVNDFKHKAERHRIDLQFIAESPVVMLWFDHEKLDKVLFNLLSNAFKYTPRGGLIHVLLDVKENTVRIQVQDNGEGMTTEEQAKAFDLFYTNTRQFNLGNGLGLALSREFITLHQGEISVVSAKGQGTTFTIRLPLGNSHLDASAIVDTSAPEFLLRKSPSAETTLPDPDQPLAGNRAKSSTILVVEDNDELRDYLTRQLGDEFDIIAAGTAEEGWQRAIDAVPDLIISDIMLPGIDGLTFTQRIKKDFRTSTIPVILLTAKGQIDAQIAGTRAGADAYITKPFVLTFLRETIRTTLTNREKWQQRYTTDYLTKAENRQEKKFLHELTLLIEQNLADPGFGVERLSREMGISRVQLYRKVQGLLQKNVNEYITEIKLRKAKILLTESTKTVAEVAYETGFSSPANFTTFFKQQTGRTPSDYRKSPTGQS